jgi:hypothetical protein
MSAIPNVGLAAIRQRPVSLQFAGAVRLNDRWAKREADRTQRVTARCGL